jgi:hypothetical protein
VRESDSGHSGRLKSAWRNPRGFESHFTHNFYFMSIFEILIKLTYRRYGVRVAENDVYILC